jgi:hypothetical protein
MLDGGGLVGSHSLQDYFACHCPLLVAKLPPHSILYFPPICASSTPSEIEVQVFLSIKYGKLPGLKHTFGFVASICPCFFLISSVR